MKSFAAVTIFAIGFACIIARFIVASGYFVQYVQDSSPRLTVLYGLGYDQLLGIVGWVCLLLGAWLAIRNKK